MKKFVFASVMVLASLCLFTAPTLKAQDLSIKDPAEYNAYQNATTQSDPKAKAAALEGFLTSYPQSIVKGAVLDLLLELYSAPPPNGLADNDKRCRRPPAFCSSIPTTSGPSSPRYT